MWTMFYVNNVLSEQYNSSPENVENLIKVWTKLSTSSIKDVNSVLGKSVLHDIVTLPWKCGQYVYECGHTCFVMVNSIREQCYREQ